MTMLTVLAEIHTYSAVDCEMVVAALKNITAQVLQEQGCHGYQLYRDQAEDSPFATQVAHSIIMFEQWQSVQHLQAYLDTAHMRTYKQQVKAHVQQVNLRLLTAE